MGDETGDESLADLAKAYLKVQYAKPGDVYLGIVHRLDRPVSGIVLFARTSKAADRLSTQFRDHTILKRYHSLVSGPVHPSSGRLHDWLAKDTSRNHVTIVNPGQTSAKEAITDYRVIAREQSLTRLELTPITGRSHQLRVQLAHAGWPIAGDQRYGSPITLPGWIALHAAELSFDHPTKGMRIELKSSPPAAWTAIRPLG